MVFESTKLLSKQDYFQSLAYDQLFFGFEWKEDGQKILKSRCEAPGAQPEEDSGEAEAVRGDLLAAERRARVLVPQEGPLHRHLEARNARKLFLNWSGADIF